MRKFLLLTGSLLFLGALGAGAWWAWPIWFPPTPSGWLSTLAKVDAALLQDRPDLAKTILDQQAPASLSVGGWLQWQKRVHAVAQRTEAWAWASLAAEAARAQYPGNTDLTAYAVWTLLKSGRAAQAAEVAGRVLPGTPWSGLAVQASVEAQGLAVGDWSALRETLSAPSAEAFTAYERLSSLESESALRKNALLTALSQGRLEEARSHLSVLTPEQRDQPPFDRLQGLMAYDQGDWVRAAALLKSLGKTSPETLMVLADVYLHLGQPEQARLIYDQLIADQPDALPPSLLVNRATLALDQGEAAEALEVLGRAGSLGAGPAFDHIRLLILEARFLVGETAAVRSALDTLLRTEGESNLALDAELLKGRLFPDWASVPRLWSLLHRHPAYSPLAERLSWLFLVAQDYPSARRVLDLHESALKKAGEDSPWWSRMLRAYLFAAEDRLAEAEEAFASVPQSWRDAAFYANWALVAQIQGQRAGAEERKPYLDNALERLTKALDLLAPGGKPPALVRRSLWLTRKGELETALIPLQIPARRGALRSAAAEDFRQAVELDPENLRASFLLRQATVKQDTP